MRAFHLKKNAESVLWLCWSPVIHHFRSPVGTQILFIIFRNVYMLSMPGCSSAKLVLYEGNRVQCSPCLLTFQRPPTSTQSGVLENHTGRGPVLSKYWGTSQGSRLQGGTENRIIKINVFHMADFRASLDCSEPANERKPCSLLPTHLSYSQLETHEFYWNRSSHLTFFLLG